MVQNSHTHTTASAVDLAEVFAEKLVIGRGNGETPVGEMPDGHLAEMESQGRYRKNKGHNLNIQNFPYIEMRCGITFSASDDY